MSENMTATLSIERELKDELRVIEYEVGNGDFHFHSQVEICIVERGSVEALVKNSQTTLEKGDIAVSLPYDPHRYIAKDGVRFSVLVIPSEMGERFCSDMKSLTSPFLKGSERGSELLRYISSLKNSENGELDRLGYVYLILGAIKKELLSEPKEKSSDSELLPSLLLYIHKNYGKNLTLQSIARAFGYHPTYISSCFKARLDIGISRYINVIRLNNAVLLMRKKKYNATEIALECGFNSARTFYRAFRREFGCSPSEYARRRG